MNKNLLRKIGWTSFAIFLLSLGILFYDFIAENIYYVIGISGGLFLILLISGVLSKKRAKNKFLKGIKFWK